MPDAQDYYPKLLEQRRAEAGSKGIAPIPADFYTATQSFLGQLYEMLEAEMRANPTSKKVEYIRSQYQRARAHARDVMDWRMSKVATLAVQSVVVGTNPGDLLPEERALFDDLVRELSEFRKRMSPFLEAHHAPSPPPGGLSQGASSPSISEETMPATRSLPSSTQIVVRVLTDGLPFVVGEGDAVELHKEDVILLPEGVARILSEARRVVPVEMP